MTVATGVGEEKRVRKMAVQVGGRIAQVMAPATPSRVSARVTVDGAMWAVTNRLVPPTAISVVTVWLWAISLSAAVRTATSVRPANTSVSTGPSWTTLAPANRASLDLCATFSALEPEAVPTEPATVASTEGGETTVNCQVVQGSGLTAATVARATKPQGDVCALKDGKVKAANFLTASTTATTAGTATALWTTPCARTVMRGGWGWRARYPAMVPRSPWTAASVSAPPSASMARAVNR